MDKIFVLRDRAKMFAQVRSFFAERQVIEVDCPILTTYASVDAHIDLIPAHTPWGVRYLHSSPEYGMKRLLAESEKIGDIYQLSHVFRDGECGSKHNPEFTMAEWYRVGMTFPALIEETMDFCRLFLGPLPSQMLTYREAFQRFAGFDYLTISQEELSTYLEKKGIQSAASNENASRDDLLNEILGIVVEPNLGKDGLMALAYYPSSQAALAQTCYHGEEEVCERFEIYYRGVELANGYHELVDPIEQRRRFIQSNEARILMNKKNLPIDEFFLKALEKGMPESCGVAVGFDRLMMLRHGKSQIGDIMPFGWNEA